jgi:hypothetical protein
MTATVVQRVLVAAFTCVAFSTIIAVPVLTLSLATGKVDKVTLMISTACVGVSLTLAWLSRKFFQALAGRLLDLIEKPGRLTWFSAMLLGAAALQCIWAVALPVSPKSDSATYIGLAEMLAQGRPYYIGGTWSYWPPGYPIYLALWLRLGLDSAAIVLVSNVLQHAASILLAYALTRRYASIGVSRLASGLLAFWPALITASGIAQKEQLLIPVLLGVVYLFVASSSSTPPRRFLAWTGAGLLLGFACLVQPSLQLFAPVLVVIAIAERMGSYRTVFSTLTVLVIAALTIAPWTIRNFRHFDSLVTISTNGGDNLYRANNPLATGAYTPKGLREYGNASEVEINSLGTRWALEWIGENPLAFARLALWKQMLFLGDESNGAYETLRRGRDMSGPVYTVAKLALQGIWWLMWLLTCINLVSCIRRGWPDVPGLAVIAAPYLYLWALHSVFESSGKYHLPVLGFILISVSLVAGAASRPEGKRSANGGAPAG